MFLIIDRNGNLAAFSSSQVAEQHMETNDFRFDDEIEMCDDAGRRYVAEILEAERRDGGILRFRPSGESQPSLPAAFLGRTTDFISHIRGG
jgi:hypothetical protein